MKTKAHTAISKSLVHRGNAPSIHFLPARGHSSAQAGLCSGVSTVLWLDKKTDTFHPTVAQPHAQYASSYFITSPLPGERGRGESGGEADVITLNWHLGQQTFSYALLSRMKAALPFWAGRATHSNPGNALQDSKPTNSSSLGLFYTIQPCIKSIALTMYFCRCMRQETGL